MSFLILSLLTIEKSFLESYTVVILTGQTREPFKVAEPIKKQECIPVGCVPAACCPISLVRGEGTWSWGVYLLPGDVPGLGGAPGPGGGGGVPAQVLPHVNRMTNRCKNITLSQTSFAGGNKRSSKLDQTIVNLRLDTRNRGTFLSKSWRQHPNVHLTIYAIKALTGVDPGFQCGTSILFVGLTNSNFVKRYKKLDEVVKSLVPGDLIPEKQVNCNASLPLNKLPIV